MYKNSLVFEDKSYLTYFSSLSPTRAYFWWHNVVTWLLCGRYRRKFCHQGPVFAVTKVAWSRHQSNSNKSLKIDVRIKGEWNSVTKMITSWWQYPEHKGGRIQTSYREKRYTKSQYQTETAEAETRVIMRQRVETAHNNIKTKELEQIEAN